MALDGTPESLGRALERLQGDEAVPWPERVGLASELGDCLRSIKTPQALVLAVQLLRHLALVRLFDSNLPMGDIFALAASAILAGLLSFTPMGLGGYDAVLIAGLTEYGMSLKTATLVAVSNRLFSLLIAVVLGAFGAFVLKIYPTDLRALRRMVKKSDSAEGREYPPDSFSSN